jgi:hypothetical protein
METEPLPSTKQQHKQIEDKQDRQYKQYKQYIDSFFSRHFLETYFHGKK